MRDGGARSFKNEVAALEAALLAEPGDRDASEDGGDLAETLPFEFQRFILAYHVGYDAVAGPHQLDAARFMRWSMYLSRFLEAQTKEGREHIQLRVDARRLEGDAQAVITAEEHAGTDASTPASPAGNARDAALASALQQAGDTTRLTEGAFADKKLLLRLLPRDDPRSVYLRAGGKLDADGNPLILGTKPGSLRLPTAEGKPGDAPPLPRDPVRNPFPLHTPAPLPPVVDAAPTPTPTPTPTTIQSLSRSLSALRDISGGTLSPLPDPSDLA